MAGHSERADLWLFREQIYESLGRRRDALFEADGPAADPSYAARVAGAVDAHGEVAGVGAADHRPHEPERRHGLPLRTGGRVAPSGGGGAGGHEADQLQTGHHQANAAITSNRGVDEWLGLFDDLILGNSALDRLANAVHQFVIEGPSYDAKLAPKRREVVAAWASAVTSPEPRVA